MKLSVLAALVSVALSVTLAHAAVVTVLSPDNVPLGGVVALVSAETINGTGSFTSSAVDLARGLYFGAWYLCTSATGTPAIKIEWQESPTTTDTDFVVTNTLESSLTAETAQLKAIAPPPMRYGQVKVTGVGANPADTVCTLKVFLQGVAR